MDLHPFLLNNIDNVVKDILMLRSKADQLSMNLIQSLITASNQQNIQYQAALKTIEELIKKDKKQPKTQ